MPSDDWWTGSPKAGLERALEMDGPLPPGEVANNPGLREARNLQIMEGLPSMMEALSALGPGGKRKKKVSAAEAAEILSSRAPQGQEAAWRLWSPHYGQIG